MMYFSEERCVMCGEIILEGRMVCLRCERAVTEQAQRRKALRFPWLTINRNR